MDGKFLITFRSSLRDKNYNVIEEKPVQQMIFTSEGKLFAPRHPAQQERPSAIDNSAFIFQTNRDEYLLKSPERKTMQIRLPWPQGDKPDLLEDILVTSEGVAISGKAQSVHRESMPLNFYWFDHDSTDAPTVLTIGETACIYNFPVASNIVFAGEKFWIAYMRPTENNGLKLSLWSWKPGDEKGHIEDLDSPAHWNSHLSMAAIENRLCLAYHCVTNNEYPGDSKIITVFRQAQ